MLKMFRYVKDKWYAIIMIVALLFLQAYCDLSLPDYTSRIVNVGIQQKGVEDGVPEEIREETMQKLFLFMSDEEQKQVEEQYTVKDGIYTLNKIDKETRDELNSLFGVPMLAVSGMSEDNEETAKMKEQMHLPADADIFQVLMQMPKEQLSQMMSAMTEKMGDMPETIVTQAATSFVQKEYVEMGKDADKMQTDYIILTGLKMLGLALLGMLAAILVTFLSCRLAASMGRNLRNHV